MSLVSIPFDSGMNEGIDTALLPQGVFREVRNMRLSRDGKLVPRPQFAAIPVATGEGTNLTAYDLWRYREQLIAVGRDSGSGVVDTHLNAWAYVDRTVADWDRIDSTLDEAAIPAFPLVTNVRDLPRPLPALGGAASASVAASFGYVCTVWHEIDTSRGYVMVQRASDGAQILYQQLPFATASDPYICPRVIAVEAHCGFVIAAVDSDDDVRAVVFNPLTMTALTSATTLISGAAITSFEIAPTRGVASNPSGFVVVASNSTPTLIVRAASLVNASTGAITFAFAATTLDAVTTYSDVTCCADSTDHIVVAARVAATGLVTAWTVNISTGATTVGPTTDIFNAAADGWTAFGSQLTSCPLDVGAATHAVIMTSGALDSSGRELTRFECRSNAAHVSTVRRDWYNSRATAGLLPLDLGARTLVLFGCELENFQDKSALAADTRDFQPSANALCQVVLDASYERPTVAAVVDQGLAGAPPLTVSTDAGTVRTQNGNIVQDNQTGKCYWVRLIADVFEMVANDTELAGCQPVVAEFDLATDDRRQTAELDSQLIIAGGAPLLFAGSGLFVEPAFEQPQIISCTPANGAGTLTNSGVYNWCTAFRWKDGQGRVFLSPPSKPVRSTFGAADDTCTLVVTTPHTRKQQTSLGSQVEVELYRTQNGGATFRLVSRTALPSLFGAQISIVDTSPDTAIASNPILYTQSQTPVAHHMAPPCKYAVPARSRVVLGGTNDETEVVFSKLVFPGEPIEFAPPGLLGYRKSIGEPVTALMGLDEQVLVASARSIYRIAGAGPDHSGQGEFLDPERIPGLGGVSDWRSVVEVPTGYFFQSSDEKLYFVDRGGAVSWVQGQAVRDTLATYPTITAATYAREQNCVFFACRNSAGSDGVLLVFDLRRECWYVDSESILAGVVTAAVDFEKRLTLASSGVVYQETPGTYLGAGGRVITGNIRNGSLCSWNHLRRIGIRGSGLGTGTPSVTVHVDYDDGAGFVSLGAHSPSTSGNYIKLWRVGQQKVDSFRVRIDAVDVALNELVLDIEPRRGVSRRNPSDLK